MGVKYRNIEIHYGAGPGRSFKIKQTDCKRTHRIFQWQHADISHKNRKRKLQLHALSAGLLVHLENTGAQKLAKVAPLKSPQPETRSATAANSTPVTFR